MKYPLREKSLEEITGGHWFVFGKREGGLVDVSDANSDVFTHLKPGVALRVIEARSWFLRQLYWLLCEEEPTTPPDQTIPERMMAHAQSLQQVAPGSEAVQCLALGAGAIQGLMLSVGRGEKFYEVTRVRTDPLSCRTVDACNQLQRYGGGVASEELADALDALTDVNDDAHHGRAKQCLEESVGRVKEALDRFMTNYKE